MESNLLALVFVLQMMTLVWFKFYQKYEFPCERFLFRMPLTSVATQRIIQKTKRNIHSCLSLKIVRKKRKTFLTKKLFIPLQSRFYNCFSPSHNECPKLKTYILKYFHLSSRSIGNQMISWFKSAVILRFLVSYS